MKSLLSTSKQSIYAAHDGKAEAAAAHVVAALTSYSNPGLQTPHSHPSTT
jgi:hypothetical protein